MQHRPGTDDRRESGAVGAGPHWPPGWIPIVNRVVVDDARTLVSCELVIPRDLQGFHGHFPSAPIVPGVAQVGWAIELARQHGLASGRCSGIVTAKFHKLVRPGMRLAARIEAGPGTGQCTFLFAHEGATVSAGRLQFGAGHG